MGFDLSNERAAFCYASATPTNEKVLDILGIKLKQAFCHRLQSDISSVGLVAAALLLAPYLPALSPGFYPIIVGRYARRMKNVEGNCITEATGYRHGR